MNREEVLEMAEKAGIGRKKSTYGASNFDLQKFARLIAEHEREACAKVCDGIMQYYKTNTTMNTDQNLIGYMAAELCGVRIRGKQ